MSATDEPDPSQPRRRPRDMSELELGFVPQRAVRWLSPGVLTGTGVRALLATIFGSYSDKREMQAVLPSVVHEHDDRPELWFDFAADVGDGFDATYSVASLLAAPSVTVGGAELPRGRLLVLGGDEVYPAASARGYEDRTKGPYRAALPVSSEPRPVILALPGNHDWYDGLTAFLRAFTQQRPIGGWDTEQTRSYFAVALPLRCWPTPAWVATPLDPQAYDPIEFFEDEIVRPHGATIRVMLSGDAHHYARYSDEDGDGARITCGTGGAYLVATHRLPDTIEVPSPRSRMRHRAPPRRFSLRTRYPDKLTSSWLAPGILRLGLRNPGFWALLGGLHTALLVALVFALDYGRHFGGGLFSIQTLRASFPYLVLAALYLYAAVLFAKIDRHSPRGTARIAGLLHGLAQLALGTAWAVGVF